ncbi:MAG: ABC transporter substrate-binding protein [Cetobacterium sp.]|uniref:ABC transporter substrate-binding protein n=1 Tax=Cetobacterium sp. TaxID=2071632 RepID=UPI003F38717E
MMFIRKSKMIKNLIFLVFTVVLLSCTKEDKKVGENLLRIAQSGNPRSLDVHNANDGFSLRINKQIYSRLVEVDGDRNIIPGLAESWTKVDDRIYDFKIRNNVKFHNGDTLELEDIKFSFERMMKSPRISFIVPPIEKIEIIEPSTLRIITKTPFAPLLYHLSHPALGIVNKKVVESSGENLDVVGTGPYKYNSWIIGDQVILDKNENYFLTPPAFDKLVFKTITEPTNRDIALETKEIDIALDISTVDAPKIETNKELVLHTKSSYSYRYLGFNNKRAVFQDENLRKAIDYAIDKEAIVNIILNGYGKVANSVIAPNVFGFTDTVKNVGYNLEMAKEFLAKSKNSSGLTLEVLTQGSSDEKAIAEVIQANLKDIGIDLKITIVESGTFYDLTEKGNFDMFLGSWGTVTGDADYGLYPMFHSKSMGSPGNRSFYSNQEVDILLDKGKVTADQNERLKIYEEAQQKIVHDTPHVMLYNSVIIVGAQKDIKGLNIHPVTLHDFYPVYREE